LLALSPWLPWQFFFSAGIIFDARSLLGQYAFEIDMRGILENLIDSIWAKHVIDFCIFICSNSAGRKSVFPAFNVPIVRSARAWDWSSY